MQPPEFVQAPTLKFGTVKALGRGIEFCGGCCASQQGGQGRPRWEGDPWVLKTFCLQKKSPGSFRV